MPDIQGFLDDIASNGKTQTWRHYYLKYSLGDLTDNHSILTYCNRLIQRNNLVLKRVVQKNGIVLYETYGQPTNPSELPSGGEVTGYTTNPFGGGAWVKYRKNPGLGIDDSDFERLRSHLESKPFKITPPREKGRVICVDIADLHIGAVHKFAYETAKTKEFNLEIISNHIDRIINDINNWRYDEVHLFCPGDIIESFSAFNHKDTFKHLELMQGQVIIAAYELLKRVILNIKNLAGVYIVSGNHDRIEKDKPGNSRRGIEEIVVHFLRENCPQLNIVYHPLIISVEVDSINHLMVHGDLKMQKANDFLFRYGKQGMYNVLRSGHFHSFAVPSMNQTYLHYQTPAIFSGNFFSESLGYVSDSGFTSVEAIEGKPRLTYHPL